MSDIQAKLKAPKGQYNNFGKYHYRSCEDIVEAVKPLLAECGYHLIMHDDLKSAGDRVYIQATCSVMKANEVIATSTALAREAVMKKGMDDSQITGTASSYARKYALNGLFAIDDTKDADTNEHQTQSGRAVMPPKESAKSITRDVYDSFNDEQKQFIDDQADSINEAMLFDDVKKAVDIFYNSKFTQEEQTAIWSKLDSNKRSAIKKFRDEQRKAA